MPQAQTEGENQWRTRAMKSSITLERWFLCDENKGLWNLLFQRSVDFSNTLFNLVIILQIPTRPLHFPRKSTLEMKKKRLIMPPTEIVKDPEHGYYVNHLPAVECRAGLGPGRGGEELGGRRLRVREGQVRVPAEVVRSVACNQSVMLQISRCSTWCKIWIRLRVREGQVRVPAEVVRSVTCNQSVMLRI